MNILITGVNGQLGSEIRELSSQFSNEVFFFEDSKTLDITNGELVGKYVGENKIEAVINCAAYTAVDKAENDFNRAEKVNAEGVKNIVTALEKVKGKLIHISTDYVFNGENFSPYTETQKTEPIGVYGKTKREGEEYVLNSNIEAIIIRTAWVYSGYGNNFVKTMMRLAKEREKLNVIFDQVGSPTYAKDLGKVCLDILININKIDQKSKIYHYSNEGIASWYDFAKEIMEIAKIDCGVYPIETKDYPTPAKRPSYSVLNKANIKNDFNIEIPYWRDSLKECIKELQKEKK
jgi:dTDP-4-dehydrorhamnose reductase